MTTQDSFQSSSIDVQVRPEQSELVSKTTSSPKMVKIMERRSSDGEHLYLLFARAFLKFKDYASLYRAKCIYHLSIMDAHVPFKKLKPSGLQKSLMFVGVNPSHRSNLEDIWQDKFGETMMGLFTEVGINYQEVWMSNLYKYPTKENRPLEKSEISQGKMELMYEAGAVDPTLIIAMGSQVCEALGAKVGEITQWKLHKVIGCLHPSILHRIPSRRKEIADVFKIAKRYVPLAAKQ